MSEVSDRIRMNEELKQMGLRGSFFMLQCQNKFKQKNGKTEQCPYEEGPYAGNYIEALMPLKKFFCPICFEKVRKGLRIDFNNLAKVSFKPVVIALACAGQVNKKKEIKKGKALKGVQYYQIEKCGRIIGIDLLHNFKKKLVKGELKCPECGSKRFVRTWIEKSQNEMWLLFYKSHAKHTQRYIELHGAPNGK